MNASHKKKLGLFLFYIPFYSPHHNIIETLWCIMKEKWIKTIGLCDY